MAMVVGVVGPHDLVDDVAAICEEQAGVRAERFDYEHETEAPAIVEAHASTVDAWLFTGVVPYTLARDRDPGPRPAGYVEYTGATLLQALVRLLRTGHDVTRLSIDTLGQAEVEDTLAGAGVPADEVRVLPYRGELTSDGVAAFHRRHGRRRNAVAITCVRSVYEALHGELPVLRLVPSAHSVRIALRALLLAADSQAQGDAQIALGMVELSGDDEGLLKEAAALGGSLARAKAGTHLLVTTRGPLAEATGRFTALPMLRRLAATHRTVRVGFGLGRTAAEAESLARRALGRARRIGDVAAVLCLRSDTDIVLEADTEPVGPELSRTVLAQRVGLSVPTLDRLAEVSGEVAGRLTTRDLADRLGVQQRTARRLLHRLERAGLAARAGSRPSGMSGRPLTLYELRLDQHRPA